MECCRPAYCGFKGEISDLFNLVTLEVTAVTALINKVIHYCTSTFKAPFSKTQSSLIGQLTDPK